MEKIKITKDERIFIPLLDNNGENSKISPHFGHAPFFGVYDTAEGSLQIIPNDLDHVDQNKSPIEQIEESANPTVIFALGIGQRAIDIIAEKDLALRTGPYKTAGDVIANLERLEVLDSDCGH